MPSMPGQVFSSTVGATSVLVLGPSEKRHSVLFFPPQTGRITLGTSSGVTLDLGPTLLSSYGPVKLCWYEFGDVIRGQWWAIADAASRVLGVIECLEL